MASQITVLFLLAISLFRLETTSSRDIYHEFNVRFFKGAPNGVQKKILGVNDQFPGPTIHATIGDVLEIKVTNNIQTKENTSIHWHGLEQYLVPFEDGPEYVTQCPIRYDQSQTYKFQLMQTGTYWWHSHHAWQYTEGYWGALIIQSKEKSCQYSDEFTIAVSDWFNPSVASLTEWYLSSASQGNPPVPDSVLINGVGVYPCDGARAQGFKCDASAQGYPVFNVTRGETYRIRVINTAAAITSSFSIDNHKLRVIEVDGVDTQRGEPVDVATLAPAQRYSFLVTMDQPSTLKRFWIRVKAIGVPDPTKFDPNGYAVLEYNYEDEYEEVLEHSDEAEDDDYEEAHPHAAALMQPPPPCAPPTIHSQGRSAMHDNGAMERLTKYEPKNTKTKAAKQIHGDSTSYSYSLATEVISVKSSPLPKTRPSSPAVILNEHDCRPIDNIIAPSFYTQQVILNVVNEQRKDGTVRWSFNRKIYSMSRNHEPALFQVLHNKEVEAGFNPINTGCGRGKVIQVVINNPFRASHPFHLHGHTVWVVGKGAPGAGSFSPAKHNSTLRLDGVRRDTVTVEGNSYVVLRYLADNPGTWLLHCHINWHLHAGLGMVFIEGSKAIKGLARPPREWTEVCEKSGLRLNRVDVIA